MVPLCFSKICFWIYVASGFHHLYVSPRQDTLPSKIKIIDISTYDFDGVVVARNN